MLDRSQRVQQDDEAVPRILRIVPGSPVANQVLERLVPLFRLPLHVEVERLQCVIGGRCEHQLTKRAAEQRPIRLIGRRPLQRRVALQSLPHVLEGYSHDVR